MAVKKGYKQTEAGKIPNDWLAVPIGDVINFQGGSQPDKSFFRQTWKPGYIRLIQIRDYKTDQFIVYIPISLARRFCAKEDIMIGRYGPPIFQILKGLEGAYNVALIKAIVQPKFSRQFCFYFLKRDTLFQFVEKLSQRSSGQTGVDLVELKKYSIPLPPTLAEQEAIATALSDADAWIESLEQLIAKKRQVKQGALQELLTGKRRLPGFEISRGYNPTEIGLIPKDWKLKTLGSISDVSAGGTPGRGIPEFWNGGIPWVTTTEVNFGSISKTSQHISELGLKNSAAKLLSPGTILLALYGQGKTRGKVAILDIEAACNQACAAIVLSEIVSRPFVFRYLASRYDFIRSLSNTGNQENLNGVIVKSIPIPLPPTFAEQEAIAETLSDIDTEIESLESKLAKAREIKKGMMQELLTGRIRLV